MDDENRFVVSLMVKRGMKAAANYMFRDQKRGAWLTYAEMRARFG